MKLPEECTSLQEIRAEVDRILVTHFIEEELKQWQQEKS